MQPFIILWHYAAFIIFWHYVAFIIFWHYVAFFRPLGCLVVICGCYAIRFLRRKDTM